MNDERKEEEEIITKKDIKKEKALEKKELIKKQKAEKKALKEYEKKEKAKIPKKERTKKSVKKTIRVVLAVCSIIAMLIGTFGTLIFYILHS